MATDERDCPDWSAGQQRQVLQVPSEPEYVRSVFSDPELAAMQQIVDALEPLAEAPRCRTRVLRYIIERFDPPSG